MEQPFVKHRTRLQAGDKAPDFKAKDQNGNSLSSGDFRGQTLVLFFYPKDDTPACTAQACSLRDEVQVLGRRNMAVLGISADNERSHAKFAKKFNLPFPLLADTDLKICHDYDVFGKKLFFGRIIDGIVRTTFIIGPDGIIQHIISDVNTKGHGAQVLAAVGGS